MRLLTAILARNEAGSDRYLSRVLDRCREFSDQILLLDDGSTDDTVEIALKAGAIVRNRALSVPAWGNEASARAELWEFAVSKCEPRDWVLFCDADMLLQGNPRPLLGARDVNAWSWRLYDVWSDTEDVYREDQFWRGHWFPRVWMVRPHSQHPNWSPAWSRGGLHVGHIPPNFVMLPGLAPESVYWLHLAYAKAEHRDEKFHQYIAKAHLLTDAERQHAESILSPNP